MGQAKRMRCRRVTCMHGWVDGAGSGADAVPGGGAQLTAKSLSQLARVPTSTCSARYLRSASVSCTTTAGIDASDTPKNCIHRPIAVPQ
eukprot:197996-Prorocentrum_minimum.AAC.1